jgi:hypothetical protein
MDPLFFVAAVLLAAFVSMGLTYSRQRRATTYDAEGTCEAAAKGTGSGGDGAGNGSGGGN